MSDIKYTKIKLTLEQFDSLTTQMDAKITRLEKENALLRRKCDHNQINEAYAKTIERQAEVIRKQSMKINKLEQKLGR